MGNRFEDYLQEFQNGHVDDLNYPLILAIAESVCPKYPAEIYSPECLWNEDTVKQIADEFFVEILLHKDRLKYHYMTQESVSGLRNALKTDFLNFLRNKKLRTEATNLYRRVLSILSNEDNFELIKSYPTSNARIFRLLGSSHEATQTCQILDEIIEVMFLIKLPPIVRYRADSKKESHLISTDDLQRLLKETLRILDKPVSVGMIFEALKYRLNLLEIETVALENALSSKNSEDLDLSEVIPNNTFDDAETTLIGGEYAEDIYERLSDRQREIFRLWMLGFTLIEIGNHTDISKSTVHDEIQKIQKEIEIEQPANDAETEMIIQHLLQLCNEYSNTADGISQK